MAAQPPPEPKRPADDPRLGRYLKEQQDPETIERVYSRVSQLLTAGEEILYIAVQEKPVVNISPDSTVLTNKRFIIYHPRLLGQADFEDYIWRDLFDAKLKEGMIGATLTLKTVEGQELSLDYLPKAQARRLYALAQQMEEAVLEERRQRELEEKRAAAGGIVLQGSPGAQQPPPPKEDPVQKLTQLKAMLDAGLITAEEYNAKKNEILSRM